MEWEIRITNKTRKQIEKLPKRLMPVLDFLLHDLRIGGPIRGNWPNFGKLEADRYHCHLIKGHPTYVAVWKIIDKKLRIIEAVYVGTHEKAPY